jgi:predicted aminopeptidase
LATFMGWEGALAFLREKYGMHSPEVESAVDHLADWKRFNWMLLTLYDELDRAYEEAARSPGGPSEAREAAVEAKERLVAAFNREVAEEPFRTEAFARFQGIPANNAYILAVVNYNQDLDLFYRLRDAVGGDLRRAFAEIEETVKAAEDPKKALREKVESLERILSAGAATAGRRCSPR